MAVKPNLALIPSGVKASKVYSVLPSDGVGDFDFSRSGSATRINKDGLIETVASNVPRLNYPLIDGVVSGCPSLLLENSATNLVTYSEDFSQLSSQSNVTITDNQVISPDGTQNASSFIDNGTIGVHRAFTIYSSTIASGQLVVHSVFAKAKEHKWFQLSTGGNTDDQWANFDLENGVIGNSSSSANPIMENYGNGWYRCILFATTSANNALLAGLLTLTNNLDATLRSPSYSGSNGGVYVFGLQIEQGSYPTSYISTSGSQTTRSAETCNNSGDANTFNDSEGVLMAEISALADDASESAISIGNGTYDERIIIYTLNDYIYVFVFVGGANVFSIGTNEYNVKEFNKIALKYKSGDYAIYINGIKKTSSNNTSTPTGLDTLDFDDNVVGLDFYGNTKQIQYFDTALNNTDLEELTSWRSFNEMAQSQLYSVY